MDLPFCFSLFGGVLRLGSGWILLLAGYDGFKEEWEDGCCRCFVFII